MICQFRFCILSNGTQLITQLIFLFPVPCSLAPTTIFNANLLSANNEERDFILGYSLSQRLLLVVYVERQTRNRIISARIATKSERRLYEQS